MRRIFLILVLTLLLGCLAACAAGKPATEAPATEAPATEAPATEAPATEAPATEAPVTEAPATEAPATEAPATETPAVRGEYVEDFTVRTIDGGTFTLSEAQKDHELVLINIFFSNCGPCGMEFPFMQQAWEENSDRVAVIALSVDPDDTDEVLLDYAKKLGLTLPMGHEEGTGLNDRFVSFGYPTTLLVDQSGRVLAVDCGAFSSKQELVDRIDKYTDENYDSQRCTYTVYCYGVADGAEVPGVVVNFCTETTCTPVTSDEQGIAVFTGPPDNYHVQVVKVPEGWELVDAGEWTTKLYDEISWFGFRETGE